jgi:hypothetical protein
MFWIFAIQVVLCKGAKSRRIKAEQEKEAGREEGMDAEEGMQINQTEGVDVVEQLEARDLSDPCSPAWSVDDALLFNHKFNLAKENAEKTKFTLQKELTR